MPVTVFKVPVWRSSHWEDTYLVSDGHGPSIEFSSGTVAGAVAAAMDARDGVAFEGHDMASLLLRQPEARLRAFTPSPRTISEIRDTGAYVASFVEVAPEGGQKLAGASRLFIGVDGDGATMTHATFSESEVRDRLREAIANRNTLTPR